MSLLTSTNLANAVNSHWVSNDGTTAAPVISGNPVQLCTGGPLAGSAGAGDANLFSPGVAGATLSLGTFAAQDQVVIGPGLQTAFNTNMRLQGPVGTSLTVVANNNISIAAFAQLLLQASGNITALSGSRIEMDAGSVLDFNNASAQSGNFRATVAPPDIPDAATQVIANPAGIVEGVYAVMVSCGGTTANPNKKSVSTVAYWSGTAWAFGGAVSAADNLELQPAPGLATLQIINGTGGTLDVVFVKFVLLATGAA